MICPVITQSVSLDGFLAAFAAMTLSGESAEAEQAYQSSGPKAVLEGLGDEREQAQRVLAELLALISRVSSCLKKMNLSNC
jgi:hypothetical protein